MIKEYDNITALHYAAYRPSLHAKILKARFDYSKKFELGLDVGCGTGQSSIALANYCKSVIGMIAMSLMLLRLLVLYTMRNHNRC